MGIKPKETKLAKCPKWRYALKTAPGNYYSKVLASKKIFAFTLSKNKNV